MKKYSILPITLYRFQSSKTPKLREFSAQLSLGRQSFDFKLGENGLYNPVALDTYRGPNGLSMRPMCMNLV